MPKNPSLVQKTRLAVQAIFDKLFTRAAIANLLMLSFILLSAVGAGMIFLPAGFIVAGIGCGLFGFLLGSE